MRARNNCGGEPLHCAAWNENAEAAAVAVQVLVAAGADVQAKAYDGDEPLHYAAVNMNAEAAVAAIRVLVAAGADVRAKNNLGIEPLHDAVDNQNDKAAVALVQALLAAGSDVQAKNNDGKTPLRLALQCSLMTAAAALVRAGPAGVVLEDLCSAEPAVACQLFPDFVASHVPLTKRQWLMNIPAACPGLGRALPVALASSDEQAGQLVCHLPPADSERLRTFALCVAQRQRSIDQRRERSWPHYLPPAVVKRILSFFDA